MKLNVAALTTIILWCQVLFHTDCHASSWQNLIMIDDLSNLINQPYVVVYFASTDGPQDAFAERFNSNFEASGSYLEDFGIRSIVVNCFLSPDHECRSKTGDPDKVYVYRNGRLLTDLPLDTLFNVDAIVANVLHLVLLQEVPLLQSKGEFDKIISHAVGKQDVMFGRMRAVGIAEDRAFIETAFAFNKDYKFVMATVNDNFGIDKNWEEGSNSIWLLKCKEAESTPCPVIPYANTVSLENMVVFLKAQEFTNMVELSESIQAEFLHLNIPLVYLSGTGKDMDHLRAIMHTVAPEFKGSTGFILINRDTVTAEMESLWDLQRFAGCSTTCAYFEAEGSNDFLEKDFAVDAFRQSVQSFLAEERSHNAPEQVEEDDFEEGELYATAQERQDDPVETAIFRLQARRELNISATQQLTDKTFPGFIASDVVTFVLFTVKWNPVCMAFVEAYQDTGLRASDIMASEFNPLARVECSNWPDVCAENNVTMYPTMKIYRGSVEIGEYHGRLDETDVLRVYMLHSITEPIQLTTEEEFTSLYEGSNPRWSKELLSSAVIGVFPEKNMKELELFEEVADELRGSFLLVECLQECAKEGVKKLNLEGPSVVAVEWQDSHQPFVIFSGQLRKENLLEFIAKSSRLILPELNPASLPSLLHGSSSIVMLFHQRDQQSKQAEAELVKVAASGMYDSLPMTWIDTQDESSLGWGLLKQYSLPIESDGPHLLYLNRKVNSLCWYPHPQQFSESLLTDWLNSALAGEGRTCAAALRHREWTELVRGYDFLAFIKEDMEVDPEDVTHSGRIRQPNHHHHHQEVEPEEDDQQQGEPIEMMPAKEHVHSEL